MSGHTVIIGYGTKGRSALASLREAGLETAAVVVVDISPQVISEANSAGLAGVTGDATRRDVLASAQVALASRLVVAVGRDDSAVLVTLAARQMGPRLSIVAAVRESENAPLLRQSGADQVVVSSEAAGRLLGLSSIDPVAAQVMSELLDHSRGLELTERPALPAELGRPARDACTGVIALLRAGHVLALDDPRAGLVQDGDCLVLVTRPALS